MILTEREFEPDPGFLNARRELLVMVVIWLISLAWTVGYCWFYAYEESGADISISLGFPTWVMWGVIAPWLASGVATILFALLFITEEDESPDDDVPATPNS